MRYAFCPPAVLDYVVPSRADGVSPLPGGVAVSLSSETAETGSAGRFCVHKLWWIQYVPDAYRIISAVLLHFCFSKFQDKRKGATKEN
jgi:hypothetical protein